MLGQAMWTLLYVVAASRMYGQDWASDGQGGTIPMLHKPHVSPGSTHFTELVFGLSMSPVYSNLGPGTQCASVFVCINE